MNTHTQLSQTIESATRTLKTHRPARVEERFTFVFKSCFYVQILHLHKHILNLMTWSLTILLWNNIQLYKYCCRDHFLGSRILELTKWHLSFVSSANRINLRKSEECRLCKWQTKEVLHEILPWGTPHLTVWKSDDVDVVLYSTYCLRSSR